MVGVAQTNVKRMLAYSSIAHGGYLLLALLSGNDVGKGAVLFYLLDLRDDQRRRVRRHRAARGIASRPNDQVRDYAGLWHRASGAGGADDDLPAVARRLPADGRLHREVVRVQRRDQGRLYVWLAIIGVLTSVVSVFFYLRIVVMMYDADRRRRRGSRAVPEMAGLALVVSALLDLLSRHPADARARLGGGVDFHDLLTRPAAGFLEPLDSELSKATM